MACRRTSEANVRFWYQGRPPRHFLCCLRSPPACAAPHIYENSIGSLLLFTSQLAPLSKPPLRHFPLHAHIERARTKGKPHAESMGCTSSKEQVAGGVSEPATVSVDAAAVVKPTVRVLLLACGSLVGWAVCERSLGTEAFFFFSFLASFVQSGFPAPAELVPVPGAHSVPGKDAARGACSSLVAGSMGAVICWRFKTKGLLDSRHSARVQKKMLLICKSTA